MTKFIIVNPYDINLYMMPYSHMFRSMSQLFYKKSSVEYFKSHGIEVYSLIHFIDDPNMKYDLMDYNSCEKYHPENQTKSPELLDLFVKTCQKIVKLINDTDEFNNSVIYAIEPLGFDQFLKNNIYDILKSKNVKVIMYQDDLHAFSIVRRKCSFDDVMNLNKEKIIFEDERIENCSYLLTMSKYLHHIDLYVNKVKLYYVPVDDVVYCMYSPNNFFKRKNKILLTGNICGYPLRTQIYYALISHIDPNHIVAKKYYDILPTIGYGIQTIDNCKISGLYAYYNQIAEYQAAFVGYFQKPLDHFLWKIFEILATGTLLFIEDNSNLDELGLIRYVHYVPITIDNLFDTEYLEKYLNTDVGCEIAKNGYEFIKKFHDNRKNMDYFIDLIRSIIA